MLKYFVKKKVFSPVLLYLLPKHPKQSVMTKGLRVFSNYIYKIVKGFRRPPNSSTIRIINTFGGITIIRLIYSSNSIFRFLCFICKLARYLCLNYITH